MTRLRGAAVEVDSRRAAQAIIAVLLATLAATASVLTVAGADRNAQIDQLRRSGVPVAITVTGCRGDLGGSGSNAAGYTCQGTFRLAGRSYPMSIPGLGHQVPGSKLRGVAVPGDPALVTTATVLAGARASWRVFLVPVVLWAVLALLASALVLRRRRRRRRLRSDGSPPPRRLPGASPAGAR